MLPYQIKLTLRDLKKYNLQETEEFKELKNILNQKKVQEQEMNWSSKITTLLEVYFYLQICNKMILEKMSTSYMKIFLKIKKLQTEIKNITIHYKITTRRVLNYFY